MSIQAIFNEQAINYLPEIKKLIGAAKAFERNQIISWVLRHINNLPKTLVEMNEKEIEGFQEELIEIFEYKEWI